MEEFIIQIRNVMKKHGYLVDRHGSVSLEGFDAAKAKAEESLASLLEGNGQGAGKEDEALLANARGEIHAHNGVMWV